MGMKGHVTIEQTKKSIKVQEIVSFLFLGLCVLVLFIGLIGENESLITVGLIGLFVGSIWKYIFIRLQKWWHHG